MALRGCDLAVSVYVCVLVLDEFAHESNRQQNEQRDRQSDSNAQRYNGALRLAAVPHEKIETAAKTNNNTEHYDDNENIEHFVQGRGAA